MKTQNLRLKMVCYWQWVKRQVFTPRSNKVFNKVNRIKSLWLFWCIYFSHRKYCCYKKKCCWYCWYRTWCNNTSSNCALFKKCSTEIDGTLVDEANFINITMSMYNLIESSDNYSDTSGSLWSFKRD